MSVCVGGKWVGVGLCGAHGPLGIIISTHNRWPHCEAQAQSHTEKLKHPWWSKQSSNLLGGAQNRIIIEAFKYKLLMNVVGLWL